jgi:hypothetical protein
MNILINDTVGAFSNGFVKSWIKIYAKTVRDHQSV